MFNSTKLLFLFTSLTLSSISCVAQTYARHGMVVSDNSIASQVGINILKKGGNAIDASVATAFALAVTHPAAGNIGGGGFLVFNPASGDATTIDFREKAPLAAHPKMFLDENGELIQGSNHDSAKAIGVPGTVAGLFLAHKNYGKLPWKELVMPSVEIATNGFPLTWALYNEAKYYHESDDATSFLKNYFLDEDENLTDFGGLWKQPELAETLQTIADKGHDGFYKGVVAQKIEDFMKVSDGIITTKDLEKYQAVERKPIVSTFNGYTIYSMPPPSSGGVTMAAMLNIMELVDKDSIPFNSTAYTHLMIETMRRGFADRAEFLGDPDFNPELPIERLISKEHAQKRFENIDMEEASISDPSEYGHPYDGESTTHFSVIDQDGNAVSVTYTLEQSYGSGLGSTELGFLFNNEMGDFNPVPGETTTNGQIGSDPNIIAPEKRMLSSMNPTIVTKNGKPHLIMGSPGGRTIINTVFQAVLNSMLYDMNVKESIEAMKIHHQWLPDVTYYEEQKLSPDTVKNLTDIGHNMVPRNQLGRLMGIQYDADQQIIIGASDSSSPDGAAIGY
ncbi:gamma-glutamyltranspeptidase / glutathione hydrolase [Nonlabens sp. Hel1_33_55]|uniref:gamma-glutamyltransferase n=1 Tax=Nonlabens sp. Hel1_33_55 TaxID=1336802 RepID=UPI000875DB8E|nr:gamma-glutamyltransferase [Nonlabens sp. Hel1_33_55]SCY20479.1 gamma-glutamyltranspeptidase / glutathione hydrolase [Nonlabens sp. Hel1_33_55]